MIDVNKVEDLKILKSALQYGLLYCKTEKEEAQFTLMLVDIEGMIAKLNYIKANVYSNKDCVFKYCPHEDICKNTEKGCIQL